MTSPPQPPVSPGPDQPYTLGQLMPAPTSPPAQPYPGPPYGPPPAGFAPAPPPPPPRKPHWWRDIGTGGQVTLILAAILTPILIAAVILVRVSDRAGSGSSKIQVTLTSCTFSGSDVLPTARVGFTVTNTGSRARTVRLRWEYRDSSGARVDTDSTRVEVPGGDTVRGEETTLLDAPMSSGTCELV